MITILTGTTNTVGSKELKEIPVGATFTGKIGHYEPMLFLKAFEVLVSLGNSTKTWSGNPTVINYVPVDLEIRIK